MKGIRIAIRFGDNDFGNTFYAVLKVLHAAFLHTGHLPEDKDKLCFLINNLSPIMYVTNQNQWEYNGLENAEGTMTGENEEFVRVKKYLQIKPDSILLNDEVDEYVKKGWDNSETFILDTYLFNNNVYSI